MQVLASSKTVTTLSITTFLLLCCACRHRKKSIRDDSDAWTIPIRPDCVTIATVSLAWRCWMCCEAVINQETVLFTVASQRSDFRVIFYFSDCVKYEKWNLPQEIFFYCIEKKIFEKNMDKKKLENLNAKKIKCVNFYIF